jgi:hypothetical protein
MATSDVIVDFSPWDNVTWPALQEGISLALRSLAFEAAENAQEQILENKQIDTGAMKASVFVHIGGSGESTRPEAVTEATLAATRPGAKSGRTRDFKASPEKWTPENDFEVKVGVSASYAVYQEDRIAFLAPAADSIREIAAEVARDRFNEVLGR